jgi:homoserine kinase
MKNQITVRVPGTTANVGPGFDSLGIALQIYNDIQISLTTLPEVEILGAEKANQGAIKMAMQAARAFFKKADLEECGIKLRISGRVPIARGLGSSVTVRLGIVAGLNQLFGKPLKASDILDVVSELEGHPDNAAPALLGGFVASGMVNGRVVYTQKKLPSKLKFIAAIPDFETETKEARKLLPEKLPFKDGVHNVNRVALLTSAFWSGEYNLLGDVLEDRFHQPYRAKLVPQLFSCLNAAKLAGAIGGWLSGSGSTVMALTLKDAPKVALAMKKVFEASGHSCQALILTAENRGITFLK